MLSNMQENPQNPKSSIFIDLSVRVIERENKILVRNIYTIFYDIQSSSLRIVSAMLVFEKISNDCANES